MTPKKENPQGRLGHKGVYNKEQNYFNSTATQRQRILESLFIGPVTTIEVRNDLDIMLPAARVMELRKLGYHIDMVWVTDITPEGESHRVASYILLTTPEIL